MLRRFGMSVFATAVALLLLIVACRDITAPQTLQRHNAAAKSLLNPSGVVVVYPDSMRGWAFYNDQTGAACPTGTACRMVQGPETPPLGAGSAELYDSLSTDGKALILADYAGTRFDQITELHYSTYRQSVNVGNNLAISLQFNVDYDLNDAATGYQGRLVYEPYVGIGGNVPQNTWQTWDAKAGKWWGTKATVTRNGASVANPCVQATPCTWAAVLTAFPNVGVHSLYGAVVLKAGSGWPGFRGNVDHLSIGISGVTTAFDFELAAPTLMPASPPDSLPVEYSTLADTIRIPNEYAGSLLRQILIIEFKAGSSIAARQAVVSSIGGVVAGGLPDEGPTQGLYIVRVRSDSTGTPLLAALERVKAFPQVEDGFVDLVLSDPAAYRKPNFGPGQQPGDWQVDPTRAFGAPSRAWALNAVNAPNAWGCSVGDSVATTVGILDSGFRSSPHLAPNVWHYTGQDSVTGHGSRVASVLAARGDAASMTGVMWYVRLDIGNIRLTPGARLSSALIYSQMRHLAWHGSRVINVSLAAVDSTTWQNGSEPAIQRTRARWGHLAVRASQLSPSGTHPLWVLAAGNNGSSLDIRWNSMTGIADSLPSETIVVTGGSRHAGALWSESSGIGAASFGQIDIVAPAEDVPLLTAGDQATFGTGTSFAAPLVTGAAGLLMSFDRSITASDARTYLIEGARAGRRVSSGAGGTYPYLDVYESLKLAAQRAGAPLCGNRVWANPLAGIQVQRSPTGQPETIIAASGGFDPWSYSYINVHHGGKRIELAFTDRYVYQSGSGWARGTWSPDLTSEYSGAFKSSSAFWQDHEDSIATHFAANLTGLTYSLTAEFREVATNHIVSSSTLANAVTLSSGATEACIQRQPVLDSVGNSTGTYGCLAFEHEGRWEEANLVAQNVGHTMDPQARFAIAAIGVWTHYREISPTWAACWGQGGNPHPVECRGFSADSVRTSTLHLWRVDRAGNWNELIVPSILQDSGEVWGMATNELGTELILEIARYRADHVSGVEHCDAPRHEWIALPNTAAGLGTTVFRSDVPDLQLCWGAYDGAGSAAAIRQFGIRASPVGPPRSGAPRVRNPK